MARLASVAALVVLLLAMGTSHARSFPRWHDLKRLRYNYTQFVRDAGRQYIPGTPEYVRREGIFEARLDSILKHNANPNATWKRGINHFADWTDDEWRSYNRATPRPDNQPSSLPSKLYEHAGSNADQFPSVVDYRDRTNPPILTAIKNQGACGSCWAHSAAEEMESFFAIRYGQLPVLSAQQIASCTMTEQGCGGGGFVTAWEAVQQFGGVNEEWTYPYTDFFAKSMTKESTSQCQNITKKFPTITPHGTNESIVFTWWPKANISAYTRVPRNDAAAAMSALATQGPLSASVASATWADYESGVLVNNYTNAQTNISWQGIDHDVQLVGYGFDFDLNVDYWVVRNSWGTNYGENGFIRLLRPRDEPCGDAFGIEVCGTSGILYNLAFPEVKPLDNQNGYYF